MTAACRAVLVTFCVLFLLAVISGSCKPTTPAARSTTSTAAPTPVTWKSIMDKSIRDADEALAKSKAERMTGYPTPSPTPAGTPVELTDDWTLVTDDDEASDE
jgi:hypothetical protein